MAHRIVGREIRDILGEGLMWSPARNAVFWVDIMGQALHRLALADGTVTSWKMPERIGWILEREGRDDFIIGLKSGFAVLTLEPFAITHLCNPEPDRPHNRLNDAKVDRWGRIWAGTKDDRDEVASGALYRLDPDGSWSRHDDDHVVTNGPAFSPDGHTFYHSDSGRRTVHRYALRADGSLADKDVFIRFDEAWGYPDGMTTDAEGGLWIAHWGGGRISRFRDDATLDRSIALPVTNVTNVVFAGRDLERMFVTSAACDAADEPLAGALFEILDHDAVGCAHCRFAG
ncbi:SMP-30/gluconolactonase/LRE family protein [Beijerinckiaceae bacterium RH AL1]|nr:SMP-30/gluconolactonase/LRE family protein [Beijerinckiaceae bacterium]VVB43561.1 SMP-30/gluconolactonase/LRE family protein [Beijerinckiaceae bacterium RH AL8]VVB43578.1 SMP-30/gluconolactonase/LRE family protein [Beijerinckiaceae bacterium RH CH11]VVC53903.1 SMP-30/gluconolactonase/LRE family protein [Beijerinckiaceae bacterium RH AL1]